jgi:hypothetical protein
MAVIYRFDSTPALFPSSWKGKQMTVNLIEIMEVRTSFAAYGSLDCQSQPLGAMAATLAHSEPHAKLKQGISLHFTSLEIENVRQMCEGQRCT